jgi:D-mannonate dehydratase
MERVGECFRWYGDSDPVPLKHIAQPRVTEIVTEIHEIHEIHQIHDGRGHLMADDLPRDRINPGSSFIGRLRGINVARRMQ